MESLRTYLNSLSLPEQQDFAKRCGTTIGYLRKGMSKKQKFSDGLAIAMERESGGRVLVEHVRPDLIEEWSYLRGTAKRPAATKPEPMEIT